jgi:hypothetical protein
MRQLIRKISTEEDKIIARRFVQEVRELANEYNLDFFIVTEGASAYKNHNNPAIKNARKAHIEWESKNNIDTEEDWSL